MALHTAEGREEVHKSLKINTGIMLALMRMAEPRRSIEYMDNRISLYAAQYGKCAVTGADLELDEIHCHHKKTLSMVVQTHIKILLSSTKIYTR